MPHRDSHFLADCPDPLVPKKNTLEPNNLDTVPKVISAWQELAVQRTEVVSPTWLLTPLLVAKKMRADDIQRSAADHGRYEGLMALFTATR